MRLALLIISFALLSACSSPRHSAPIVDRTARTEVRPQASAMPGTPRQMDSQGYYAVRRGDTLFQIAQDFGQSHRDLVVWNNLANPNDIRVDQLLRVIPPVTPAGNAQAATAASTAPAIEVRPLMAPMPNKSGPRGEKQPYSENTLTEMQKPDAVGQVSTVRAESLPQDKPANAPAANAEDAGISWMWPTEGKILATFENGKKGIDIAGKSGQPVLAAAAGKVMYAGSGIRGYGNLVIVKHTTNLLSAYAHNKTILVKEGQTVAKGEKIAEMGNTDADAVKLHFEIRQQGKPVDPSKFLPGR